MYNFSFNVLFANHKKSISMMIVISLLFAVCSCNNSSFDGFRFSDTRHISVLVNSNTAFDSEYSVNNSQTAIFIHDAVLKECNIDVQFIDSDVLWFEYGISADISYTEDYNILNTYYKMHSVTNLSPYLNDYSYAFNDLVDLLGNDNLYYCTDDPNELWFLSARDFAPDSRVTFIRYDWLEKLGLNIPSNRDELYNCLIAFRNNADLLLGEDSSKMIPFFIDNEPGVSAKPLFDSFLDTEISDEQFYINGYCRVTQEGYKDGLELLNNWYTQDLLPSDFYNIVPNTKESYEPIESGYVGAFCAKYDYLYANGDESHIKAFYDKCGSDAEYIAINTFENCYGAYTSWDEDYLEENNKFIFLPSTCSDPLACLVYLNWISDQDNITKIMNINDGINTNDPFTSERYLITCSNLDYSSDLYDLPNAEIARQTALSIEQIHRGNICVRYDSSFIKYSDLTLAIDLPKSTDSFICSVICTNTEEFENLYSLLYDDYYSNSAAHLIIDRRIYEWDKVMNKDNMLPW